MTDAERYKRSIAGARARIAGAQFEHQIEASIQWHIDHGILKVNKTPEPMKPLRAPNRQGQFLACYTKKAQVDFCGTMKGGRSVRFEAKQTDSDRFERKRLTDDQMDDLREHQRLGALCFVLLCFGFDKFYRVPWHVWENMKQIYGRQYVKEQDLKNFRIPSVAGVIKIMHGIVDTKSGESLQELPDICVACGEYAGEDGHLCPACRQKAGGST